MSGRRVNARLAFVLLAVAAIAACDRSPTEPVAGMRARSALVSIEGDTLSCRFGWQVVNGRYVCNEQ